MHLVNNVQRGRNVPETNNATAQAPITPAAMKPNHVRARQAWYAWPALIKGIASFAPTPRAAKAVAMPSASHPSRRREAAFTAAFPFGASIRGDPCISSRNGYEDTQR
jgi:hypothetical protein